MHEPCESWQRISHVKPQIETFRCAMLWRHMDPIDALIFDLDVIRVDTYTIVSQLIGCIFVSTALVYATRRLQVMQDKIEKTVELKAPITRVWRAVTDHEEFGEWFQVKLDGPFVVGEVSRGRITYPGYEHMKWEAKVQAMGDRTAIFLHVVPLFGRSRGRFVGAAADAGRVQAGAHGCRNPLGHLRVRLQRASGRRAARGCPAAEHGGMERAGQEHCGVRRLIRAARQPIPRRSSPRWEMRRDSSSSRGSSTADPGRSLNSRMGFACHDRASRNT